MKRVELSEDARDIVRSIHGRYLREWIMYFLLCMFGRNKPDKKARFLAQFLAESLTDFSRLYTLDPRFPKHVPVKRFVFLDSLYFVITTSRHEVD